VDELIGHFHRLQAEGETEEGTWFLNYLDMDQELATAENSSLIELMDTQGLAESEQEEAERE
jgi:hypothetical protein